MPSIETVLNEADYLLSVLPGYFLVTMAVVYFLVGGLVWSRFLYKWEAEEGLDDHLVRAERIGTHSTGETVALLVVKLSFYLLWPLFLILKYGCKLVGLLRFGTLRHAAH